MRIERAELGELYHKLYFNFNQTIVKAVKNIEGAHFVKEGRYWNIPVARTKTLERFYKKYYLKSIASAPAVVHPIPELPMLDFKLDMKLEPYTYQQRGIAFNIKNKRALIGDKPGLGKTIQSIGTIIGHEQKGNDPFPVLVICPATLKLNWQAEWLKCAGRRSLILSDKNVNTWHLFYEQGIADVFIVNYESLKKFFVNKIGKPERGQDLMTKHIEFKPRISLFKSVIIDELHKCKDKKTLQTKFVLGISRAKEFRLGLTGTPIVNKLEDLIPQLHILGQMKALGGEDYFVERYCATDKYRKELSYLLGSTCFYQREKKEVLSELPDKVRQTVYCDITTRKEYIEAEADLKKYLLEYKNKSEAEANKSMAGEVMVRIGVCRNISARGKLDTAAEEIDQVISSGEKIVVFVHQLEIGTALIERYKGMCMVIRGGISMDERDRAIQNFQKTDWCKVAICSIKAAGVGITLTASSTVLFVEQPWHAADEEQCEDRCHRIGQKNSVRCIRIVGKNTVDEYINELIDSKRKLSETVTGNVDQTQNEIIDKLSESLFNKSKAEA